MTWSREHFLAKRWRPPPPPALLGSCLVRTGFPCSVLPVTPVSVALGPTPAFCVSDPTCKGSRSLCCSRRCAAGVHTAHTHWLWRGSTHSGSYATSGLQRAESRVCSLSSFFQTPCAWCLFSVLNHLVSLSGLFVGDTCLLFNLGHTAWPSREEKTIMLMLKGLGLFNCCRMNWEMFSPVLFFEEFVKNWYYFSLNIW